MTDSPIEIIASVFFDSWFDDSPELRSEAAAQDRHLIYEGAGALLLDLLIKQMPDNATHVSGQVLPGTYDEMESFDQVANLPVLMEQVEQGENRISSQTNSLGEFIFALVPEGTWNLTIAFSDKRFVVRGLSNQGPHRSRPSADDNLGAN